ncbi:MAG TPA: MerR family transcriptional regulator [Candidatus Nitrosotenuis sp.]|nr:MerR family transcriptional regulator [Candidatus Nitrosotenuis sp.]
MLQSEAGGLTIGQLADAAGVGVETVRFYERQGLLARPPRPVRGYRRYPAEAALRLRFIKRARELGFSLREVKELLSLASLGTAPPGPCRQVEEMALARLRDVRRRISALRRLEDVLEELTRRCREEGIAGECPVLEALSHPEVPLPEGSGL